jgi:hypothetical protein
MEPLWLHFFWGEKAMPEITHVATLTTDQDGKTYLRSEGKPHKLKTEIEIKYKQPLDGMIIPKYNVPMYLPPKANIWEELMSLAAGVVVSGATSGLTTVQSIIASTSYSAIEKLLKSNDPDTNFAIEMQLMQRAQGKKKYHDYLANIMDGNYYDSKWEKQLSVQQIGRLIEYIQHDQEINRNINNFIEDKLKMGMLGGRTYNFNYRDYKGSYWPKLENFQGSLDYENFLMDMDLSKFARLEMFEKIAKNGRTDGSTWGANTVKDANWLGLVSYAYSAKYDEEEMIKKNLHVFGELINDLNYSVGKNVAGLDSLGSSWLDKAIEYGKLSNIDWNSYSGKDISTTTNNSKFLGIEIDSSYQNFYPVHDQFLDEWQQREASFVEENKSTFSGIEIDGSYQDFDPVHDQFLRDWQQRETNFVGENKSTFSGIEIDGSYQEFDPVHEQFLEDWQNREKNFANENEKSFGQQAAAFTRVFQDQMRSVFGDEATTMITNFTAMWAEQNGSWSEMWDENWAGMLSTGLLALDAIDGKQSKIVQGLAGGLGQLQALKAEAKMDWGNLFKQKGGEVTGIAISALGGMVGRDSQVGGALSGIGRDFFLSQTTQQIVH